MENSCVNGLTTICIFKNIVDYCTLKIHKNIPNENRLCIFNVIMAKLKMTKDFRTRYIHVALDLKTKEKLDQATGRYSVYSKTGLVNFLLKKYFQAVENGQTNIHILS